MKKIMFIILFFFCTGSVHAVIEKASIVFTAGLNDITNTKRGGYAELASLLNLQRKKQPSTFFIFGGNSLFPSILSSFDQGTHIIDLLNSLEPDVMAASAGDFAYSEDELSLRTYEAAFPIVQSNIISKSTKKNLDGLLDSVIIQQDTYKLGFVSLMDEAVIEAYNLTQIKIKEPHLALTLEVKKLRKQGADFIILHYRGHRFDPIAFVNEGLVDVVLSKNDKPNKLFEKHPRQIFLTEVDQVAVIDMSWQKNKPQTLKLQWQAKKLSNYTQNSKVHKQLDSYTKQLDLLLDEIIAVSSAEIDTSLLSQRTKESVIGNFIADLVRKHSNADIALINSGAIRGGNVYPRNSKIRRRDIIQTLSYRNTVVLLEVSGAQLISALENGVSQVENMGGRFPQTSGMKIVFDSTAPAGQRIVSVLVNNRPLQALKRYKLATSSFIANGGDGYQLFKKNKRLIYNQQMSKLITDILIHELRLTDTALRGIESRIVDVTQREAEQL